MLTHFNTLMEPINVIPCGGSYDGGEWQKTAAPPTTESMVSIPVTPAMARTMPEGEYTIEDRKFYSVGEAKYPKGTIFVRNDVRYRVRDISDRSSEGGFTTYWTKREVKQ